MLMLSQIAKILSAQQQGANISLSSFSTDTRTLQAGDLFIALKGPKFNANEFVMEAEKKGAGAAIVSEAVACQIPILIVEDTRLALGQIAAYYRQQFNIPVIGLTGSCGKTTTKAMLANILQNCGPALATEGTLNNDIGVPLTLLRLRPEHEYAVIEMGANHLGEIAYVTNITKPTVAFITNAAPAHLEGFGNLEGVARGKGEIFQGLADTGTALINADDHYADFWKQLIGQRKMIQFGRMNAADVTAKAVQFDINGYAHFVLVTPSGEVSIQLQMLGEHNIMNALAAAAAALAVNAPLSAIKTGLETIQPVKKRLAIYPGKEGAIIIDDSYNANPLSVSAAIQLLAKKSGERILALGDMRELGPNAANYHQEIGAEAKRLGIDRLYAYGDLSEHTVKAFGKKGFHFNNQAALIDALQTQLKPGVTVLVKGSLSTRMSNVVAALVKE